MKRSRPFVKVSLRMPQNLRLAVAGEVGQALFVRLLSQGVLASGHSIEHGGLLPAALVSAAVANDPARARALAVLASTGVVTYVQRATERAPAADERLARAVERLGPLVVDGGFWIPSWSDWYGSALAGRSAAAERSRRYRARKRGVEAAPARRPSGVHRTANVGSWVPVPVDVVETTIDDRVLMLVVRLAIYSWRKMDDGIVPLEAVLIGSDDARKVVEIALEEGALAWQDREKHKILLPWWTDMVGSKEEVARRRDEARDRRQAAKLPEFAAAPPPASPEEPTLFDIAETPWPG